MMRKLGTVQRYMASCSVTSIGDLLLVGTSNGRDPSDKFPASDAPSFIALDKTTGKLLWADNSPGVNVLDGQWSSPAAGVLGGVPQAIFAGGDGWLYSFQAASTADGKAKLLWRFDCNPKDAVWSGSTGRRNTIIATPVIAEGRVYIATGQDPEAGEGAGDLWCIDPTRRGDVSPELVVDRQGKPVPPQRLQAVDAKAGQKTVPNPNSAVVWHYVGTGKSADSGDFQKVMHRSLSMAAVKDGLLVTADFAGLVHCLDAKTGRACWTHDMLSAVWGSPLVADGKIYLGNDDGDIVVFALSSKLDVLAKNPMGNSVYTTPVAVGDTLYVATRTHLIAIRK
jgi:outer membrane protein assembly factor BamB